MGQHWADTAVSNGYHDHYLSLVDHYLNIEGNGLKLQSVTIQTSMVMGYKNQTLPPDYILVIGIK